MGKNYVFKNKTLPTTLLYIGIPHFSLQGYSSPISQALSSIFNFIIHKHYPLYPQKTLLKLIPGSCLPLYPPQSSPLLHCLIVKFKGGFPDFDSSESRRQRFDGVILFSLDTQGPPG